MTEAVRRNIFVSYAHEDSSWLDRFLKALRPAVSHNVEIWCDRDMPEGTDWQSTIEAKLESASSALVLVTDAFLSSSFVTGVELPAILKRHRAGLLYAARCPEARAMFANIDEQYAKLDAALQALLDFPSGTRLEPTALTHLADVHRMHRIGTEQLEHFANSFLDTLKEECGEQDQAVEAWNLTFRVGLAYMKQQLARVSPPQVPSVNESVAS